MLFELNSVSVHYRNKMPALHNIDLLLDAGTVTLIIGPTGAGKTTLLKLLQRDVTPTFGHIYFKGSDFMGISSSKLRLLKQITGIIPQQPELIHDLNTFENVMIPLLLNGYSRDKANKRCLEVMAEFKINYIRTKYPDELSLGERKLVTAARALTHNPQIILADEPTENLDDNSKLAVLDSLSNYVAQGSTVIIATNDAVLRNVFKGARAIYLKDGRISERLG